MVEHDEFYGWWDLSGDTIGRAMKAAERMTQRASKSSYRDVEGIDSTRAHFIGNCGEAVFARACGLPEPDFMRKATGKTDGGEDFKNIDVKTTSNIRTPELRVWTDKQRGSKYTRPAKVRWFVLIVYDEQQHRGRIGGYATRSEIFAAPIKIIGKHTAHYIPEARLHKPERREP